MGVLGIYWTSVRDFFKWFTTRPGKPSATTWPLAFWYFRGASSEWVGFLQLVLVLVFFSMSSKQKLTTAKENDIYKKIRNSLSLYYTHKPFFLKNCIHFLQGDNNGNKLRLRFLYVVGVD